LELNGHLEKTISTADKGLGKMEMQRKETLMK
jgi:hypothetical protein